MLLQMKLQLQNPYGDSDVDAHLNPSTATTGQALIYDGADYVGELLVVKLQYKTKVQV